MSVRLSVCHTSESHLNGSRFRNMLERYLQFREAKFRSRECMDSDTALLTATIVSMIRDIFKTVQDTS